MQKIKLLFVLLCLTALVNPGLQAQEVSLDIVESAGGCGLTTDCVGDFICFDIRMTVDEDRTLDSYNIWVQYNNSVLSRVNGGADSSCVLAYGGFTDIENSAGAYRVTGVPGTPFPLTADMQEIVHTICFAPVSPETASSVGGESISVGGTVFGLQTTVTFTDAIDDVPEETQLILSEMTFTCLQPLPVDLLSFEAERKGSTVDITWKTANEYNNSHFEIERSRDGRSFDKIASVESKGNSSNHQNYHTRDLNPKLGDNFYRLKQVDLDGKYSYSEIRTVRFDASGTLARGIEVYPNPATEFAHITFEQTHSSASINILNSLGEIVEHFRVGENAIGLVRHRVDISKLPEGTYFIQLLQGDSIEMSQIIKIN